MKTFVDEILKQKDQEALRLRKPDRPVLLKSSWPGENGKNKLPMTSIQQIRFIDEKEASDTEINGHAVSVIEGQKLSPDLRIREGTQAPDFALPDSEGRIIKLSDFRGKKVVLYFYSRNMTPSCSMEACGFRDFHGYFRDKGIVIIGVSIDSEKSHRKFKNWFGLPYTLLSDEYGRVARMYGLFQKKNQNGREFWSVKRSTFAIGPDGEVLKVWDKVDVNYHHQEVLRFFDGDARNSKTARNL